MELFSIRIQRTFQLVSTSYKVYKMLVYNSFTMLFYPNILAGFL